MAILRQFDLIVLAIALAVFVAAGLPIVGYAAAAAAWLAQKAVFALGRQRTQGALAEGNRNLALGTLAAATLGRVWIVTLAILLVGLLSERENGLAAAVLSALLVTVHLATEALARLLEPETS